VRAARGRDWTARTVAWYERAIARSDYALRVLAAAAPLLGRARSALDVGAGFGALALPLARRLERVTALEPAPAMAAALRRAIAREGLGNVAVLERAWEAGPAEPHDLVVCAHVGPLLGRGSRFLEAVTGVARRGVILVRDAPGGDAKFFFSELYPVLRGRAYGDSRGRHDVETLDALAALGVRPAVVPIEYDSDQPFASLDEAVEFWTTWMDLSGPAAGAYLREFLARRLVRRGDEWIAPYRKRAVVVWWRTGPDPPGGAC